MEQLINIEVNELLDRMKVLHNMYEIVRLVDPIKKKVLSLAIDEEIETGSHCFEIWQKNKICDNCISARAYNENKTYVKIEYNSQYICMVTAVPIELKDRRVIAEFMKDATNTFIFKDSVADNTIDVYSLIDQLNTAAFKDDLTKIYNRRFINERLPVEIINAFIKNEDLSIIMADIDYFKKINDIYGHTAGDEVLMKFSDILSRSIRKNEDWAARYGGEEFLVCLPGASADIAAKIAESARKALESHFFDFCPEKVNITSSFGVCSLKEVGSSEFKDIIDCADRKLYKAKYDGRNRVEK